MRLSTSVVVIVLALAAWLYARDGINPVMPQLAKRPSDFENYYLASRNLAAGESPFAVSRYDYPPIIAFLLWPLAGLEYETVRWIWFLVSHACILGAAFLTWSALGKDRLVAVVVALLWSCGGTLEENLALGQVNPILLLLVAAAMFTASTGTRSVALGSAIAIKLWPAALVPALWLGRLSSSRQTDSESRDPRHVDRKDAASGEAPAGTVRTSPVPVRSAAPDSAAALDSSAEPRRALAATAAVAAVLLGAPFAILAAFYPPPHTPTHSNYWMGTPALLNFSAPAAVLRLLDFPASAELPHNWQFGNDVLELRLPAGHAAASVAAGAAIWLMGFALLAAPLCRPSRTPQAASQRAPALTSYALGALVPLSLAAVPLSWSHYQLLQLPGAALFLALALHNRRVAYTAAIAALFLLTYQAPVALLRIYFNDFGWTAARPWLLWAWTALSPAASLGLFLMYRRLIKRMEEGTLTRAAL